MIMGYEETWLTKKFLYHNPYNIVPKVALSWEISERSLGQTDEPVDVVGLAMTAAWQIPVMAAKGLQRVGLIGAGHKFGYWRSAAIIPRGMGIVGTANLLYLGYLGHQTYQFAFAQMRAGARAAEPRVHVGGRRSFPNPISGM